MMSRWSWKISLGLVNCNKVNFAALSSSQLICILDNHSIQLCWNFAPQLVWALGWVMNLEIWIQNFLHYFLYAIRYICEGTFWIFKKRFFYYCKNALEDLAYPIEIQILKFWILGIVIHPKMQNRILRLMVKDLAQLDLPFLSYDQITVNYCHFLKNGKNWQFFGHN